MDTALADLIRISNRTGGDATLVQGGGGNTSVKTADGRYMYIKASGTALKDMNEKQGWRRLRLDAVLSIIEDDALAQLEPDKREPEVVNRLLLACEDDVTSGARPSVESHLHALLDRCVIHLHPLVVAAYVNSANGRAELEKLFKDLETPVLWVPYADPGFTLARRIARLVEAYQRRWAVKPRILFLEKHGLFVTAQNSRDALKLVDEVIRRCARVLPVLKAAPVRPEPRAIRQAQFAIRKAVFEATGQYLPVSYYPPTPAVAAFMRRADAGKLLATPALNPDELVYANGSPMWVERADAELIRKQLQRRIRRGEKPAAAYIVKALGLFVAADKKTTPVVAEIAEGSLMIRAWTARFGGIRTLSKRQQQFINNWESEAFRKQLASSSTAGPLQNRIALVTGAGSGLGRSIAVGLAKAGAMVALADIDVKAAEQTAQQIYRQNPRAHTLVLSCNVTEEKAVQDAFEKLLQHWGGLDILVNAAGIAPAYPLVQTPLNKWKLALEVNLTGYFLMARQAARIMIEQAVGGSIINISSKSGLEASKNNTAYNATKAGEIHMARGWALELGEYGIRVNCVAPGNVFEGSKIWNPQYIKACAAKYGIKPEEVIPFYISKTALKREITGQDVADSVVFLCSDQARTITGQVLVCDSGQVMVR